MRRMISLERRTILVKLLKGEVNSQTVARELGISLRRVTDLRRLYLKSKLPQVEGRVQVSVDQPVFIRRDRWGVAHIQGKSLADSYIGLGYAMAQDKLWTLDFMRRQSQGRLAEVLGPDYLGSDRFYRTIGLSRASKGAVESISDEVRLVLEALSEGINAGIDSASGQLPVEFDLLDYEPETWEPIDSIAIWKWRWWMLTGRLDAIAAEEAARFYLPPHLLDLFFSIEAGDETIVPSEEPAGTGGYDNGEGSNNWVVGAGRSIMGKPILATDPHNPVDLSNQWYQAQVTAPGMDAIGAFYLGTPGIYLGHTRKTAWGATNHSASARDLYREKVSPEDPGLYQEGNVWKSFEMERQKIPVLGQDPDLLTIRRTVRGPVVSEFVPDIGDGHMPVLSLSWAGADPNTGFEAMLALHRSSSLDEVVNALRQWPFPNLNFVFADVERRIGYHVAGTVPKRGKTWYGFRPAGDPRHKWKGTYGFDELPKLIDPERDWVGSANNPPLGGRSPYLCLGNWADGNRFLRIRERIKATDKHTLESVAVIQADVVHARAQKLAPIIGNHALESRNRNLRRAGELLRDWDGAYGIEVVAPSIFTAFWEHWLERLAQLYFPEQVIPLVKGRLGNVGNRLLLGEELEWFSASTDLNKEVLTTLGDSLEWLRQKVGPRYSQWRWGRLHKVRFEHPLSKNKSLSQLLDVGSFETSGGTGTVRCAGYSMARPFQVINLATYRMAVDMADPARALATTAGGQSGHLASSNYKAHSKLWVADEYHPLLMDMRDIQGNLDGTLVLEQTLSK